MSKRVSKMGWIVLAALLCLSLVISSACTTPSEEEPETGIPYKNDGIFVQETIGGVDSLDPAYAYDTASGEQIYYMYEGLLGYDGGDVDKFVGLMADTWTIAPDSLSITLHIRPGIKFSNGDTMTVEDVEYSFERAMVEDPDGGPVWMFYTPLLDLGGSRDLDGNIAVTFDQIDQAVEIVNGDSIQFNFVRPYPMQTFQEILCGSWGSIVDKAFCIAQGDWDGTEATWESFNNPAHEDMKLNAVAMGTGPWALDAWEAPAQIKLVKNNNYWKGADTVPFDRVITKFVDTWASRKLSLLAGDADLVYVPRTNISDVIDVADLNKISGLPDLTIDAFYFNQAISSDSPYIGSGALDGNGIPGDFFTDIDVRKGFSYAFDWDTYIAQAMQGEAEQRGSPIVKGLPYYNPNAAMYSLNLAQAEEHLKAAWGGEVWEKGFKLTLIYNTGNLVRKVACEILANNLFAMNPKFQISVLAKTWTSTMALLRSRTLAMYQIGWLMDYADPDNFVVPYMASYGVFSYFAAYNNPHVDDLIAEGAIETDTTQRQQIYYELQQIWYDDAPGIAIAQPFGRRFFTKYIKGFYFNPGLCGQPGPLYYMTKSES